MNLQKNILSKKNFFLTINKLIKQKLQIRLHMMKELVSKKMLDLKTKVIKTNIIFSSEKFIFYLYR